MRVDFEGRSFKDYAKVSFQNDLRNYDWDKFFLHTDPEDAWFHL